MLTRAQLTAIKTRSILAIGRRHERFCTDFAANDLNSVQHSPSTGRRGHSISGGTLIPAPAPTLGQDSRPVLRLDSSPHRAASFLSSFHTSEIGQ